MSGSVSSVSGASSSVPSAQDLQSVEETIFESAISLGGSIQNQENQQSNDAISEDNS